MKKKKGCICKKSQFSMEYLMMMGFTLVLLIPTILLFATESQSMKSDIAASQATQIARKIADKAEEMYYQGEPARTTIKVTMPQNIQSVNFSNREIVFLFKTPDNVLQEIVQVTTVNITGNITSDQGIHFIEIKAEGDYVLISEP